jgi:hypothetical protein
MKENTCCHVLSGSVDSSTKDSSFSFLLRRLNFPE